MSYPPSDKAAVLTRIREALRLPARVPHQDSHAPSFPALPGKEEIGRWLPAVGAGYEERVALFARQAAALKADFVRLPALDAVPSHLAALAQAEGWPADGIASHPGEHSASLVEKAGFRPFLALPGYDRAKLESCAASVTACEALIAQTGSVLVTTRESGGRALTILPPHHIVVATRDQLVPDLPAAFARLRQAYGGTFPSMISFITGPSRTGDIERILVLGAHGPKKLTILFVG